MVLRYVLWQGYLPEYAGIFFKKDRVIADRTKSSRDHLRQSLTKLDKKVLSRLETLGQKMFSCKDRYVVPDLQTFYFASSIDICLVLSSRTGVFKIDQFALYLVAHVCGGFSVFWFFSFFHSFSTEKMVVYSVTIQEKCQLYSMLAI